jgi:FAD/FMN-containing dehydrogenase
VIVQAGSNNDVRDALAFARENDLQVVCRASGHSTAGAPLRNGGMLINVAALNSIDIDPGARIATVQAGANMVSLYSEAKRFGLDFPTADCTTVALTGFMLGGGLGRNGNYLTRGPVCNALLSAEVMLESGDIVTVDADGHSDIYWAMRGCGPAFFGIVMSMRLRLFDPVASYLASSYTVPLESLPEVLGFFDERQSDQDPRVNIRIGIRPDSTDVEGHVASVGISAFAEQGANSDAVARALLARYADEGLVKMAVDASEFVPQDTDKYMFTRDPSGSTHTDNIYTDDASSLLPALEVFKTRPEGLAVRLDLAHNQQFHAPYSDDISYSPAGSHFLSIYVDWTDSRLDALAYDWTDEFSSAAAKFQQGHYLNQVDTGVYPEKIRQSFSAAKWQRLEGIRRAYDPNEQFFTYVGLEA